MPTFSDQSSSPCKAAEALIARLAGPSTILAAVSGGSDSIGLLLAFHQVLAADARHGHKLVAATVDHGLRPEAADEADAVFRLCAELSIPHIIRRWDGEKPKSGISAASRDARYRLLIEAADSLDADVIITGHTLDDQIETVSMRAARSDSESNLGLAGMAEAVLLDRRRWLLRPFLATRREAIRDFLLRQGRGWADDPSNADRHYERVRVRESLVDRSDALLEAIQSAARRRSRLAEEAAELARRHLRVEHGVLARLAPEALSEQSETLRHLLANLAAILGGRQHLPAATTMDRVMAMLDGRHMGRTTAGRVMFDLRRQGLFMHRENRDQVVTRVDEGETVVWDGRYRIGNLSDDFVTVGASSADRNLAIALFPDAPPAIAMRAMGVMPDITAAAPSSNGINKASVIAEPILAPYDRFLPQFDLILASELGLSFGCDEFPAAPIKVFERKS
ncbi:tRNA lysidine(34) synthetase TilS [Aliirhizobium smilacinae]|uniref:tRNA lysidine(34) synthetase TilS n=1 Tax=Aliirhizobium smilacinae TaxID=1395944 RepID=UPI0015D5BDC7|nr:tRNA lysidine(34) synthetase TilS [Rhizobium smilacinae]